MTWKYLWAQPWFKAVIAALIFIIGVVGLWQFAKYKGRQEAKLERDKLLVERDKQIVALQNLAAKHRATSELYKSESDQLKEVIATDRKNAQSRAIEIEQQNSNKKEQIDKQYEQDKKSINDMSDCDRCIDICSRANALANTYGGFFNEYRCDAKSQCAEVCNTY